MVGSLAQIVMKLFFVEFSVVSFADVDFHFVEQVLSLGHMLGGVAGYKQCQNRDNHGFDYELM